MTTGHVRVRADAELRRRLAALLPETDRDGAEPADADRLLARIVWSRLLEPGDAVAGALIAALGPAPLLDMLASGADARTIGETARAASGLATPDGELSDRRIAAGLGRWLPRLNRSETLEDIDRGIAAGMRVVAPESPSWPRLAEDLGPHAPVLLWTRGDESLLSAFSLAVVGARACTGYGAHLTAELTGEACAAGIAIISGAAYGIDAVAHRTALASESPTAAVLAGGADRPYPAAHGPLLDRIAATGLVCSEMVPGAAPTRWRFLQRNRIIAALSRATLVTEAGARSGSINTAGHAAELGRALGAVPGPVTSAASAGCHRLIRDYDATLVTNGAELREFLGISGEQGLFDPDPEASGDTRQPALHRRILDALPLRGGRTAGEAARRAGVALEEARGVLAELELLGYVSRRETPDGAEAHWQLQRRE